MTVTRLEIWQFCDSIQNDAAAIKAACEDVAAWEPLRYQTDEREVHDTANAYVVLLTSSTASHKNALAWLRKTMENHEVFINDGVKTIGGLS